MFTRGLVPSAALAAFLLPALPLADCGPVDVSFERAAFGAGEIVELQVHGVPGTVAFLLVDSQLGVTALPGIGTLGLALSPDFLVLNAVVLDPEGNATLPLSHDCGFAFLDVPLFVQAAAVSLSPLQICLSNVEAALIGDLSGECSGTGAIEGCTPGYWKNHPGAWVGFSPGDDFDATFGVDVLSPDLTLLQVLDPTGPLGAAGAHAVAAILSASHGGTNYLLTVDEVIDVVHDALSGGEASTIEAVKDLLVDLNEAGCPL